MKVGEYVRTKQRCFQKPQIAKIKKMKKDSGYKNQYYIELDHNLLPDFEFKIYEEDIEKSSPNIIDLIEVGDYVNGYKVTYVVNEEPCPSGKFVDIDCDKDSSDSYFFENDIKTIVTKEQFSQNEYRIWD